MIPLFIYAGSPWDPYTLEATGKYQQWFQFRASRMSGWSPWFDAVLPWFPKPVTSYMDAYAIYNSNPTKPTDIAATHPEWILKDKAGNKLYIPFGCANGTCPQYAGNFQYPGFIKNQTGGVAQFLKLGYSGPYLDDVNLPVRCGDGNGNPALPPGVTAYSWAKGMAEFVEQLRAAEPKATIIHNPIWFADSSIQPFVDRQIKACDLVNCERGFGDPNFNPQSFSQFMSYIDHVHSLGRPIISMEYTKDNLSFKVAAFLLVYQPGDLMAVLNLFPDAWDPQMDIEFGEPLGPRQAQVDGTVTRQFTHAQVSVNFGQKTGTVTLQ